MMRKACTTYRGSVVLMFALGVFSFGLTDNALGQIHGIFISKGCTGPVCLGELTACNISFGYNDGHGDTLKIHAAWDVEDVTGDAVRIPAEGAEVVGDTFSDGSSIGDDDGICEPDEVCLGNLPIVSIAGNTTCTVSGSLPCVIGPGGSVLNGLPGDPQPGLVSFHENSYVVQSDDPDPVVDRASVQWEDLCDGGKSNNCGVGVLNLAQAPGSTPVTRCDDGDPCTTDTCSDGECTFTPDCVENADCDDMDECTMDVCFEGCCTNVVGCTVDAECDDKDACTTDTCGADGCCINTPLCTTAEDCNDDDACATDTCGADGCCINTPLCTTAEDCNDDDACTTDTCGEDGCCVNTPLCTTAADCDDGDVCTTDTCGADGCCVNTPLCTTAEDCNDDDACTTDTCGADGCCVNTPAVDGTSCADGDLCNGDETCQLGICTAGSALNCDDGDLCTNHFCDPILGCVNPPAVDGTSCADGDLCNGAETCQLGVCAAGTSLVCDDGNPCTDDFCDPILGCITTPSCVCGNDTVEGAEECDGTDDSACPGACLSDCTCVCDAASGANCHLPAEDGFLIVSDSDRGFVVSDDFAPLGTSVTDVCWRGVYNDVSVSPPDDGCGPGPGDDFTVTIYNDAGGYPGTVLSSQSVTPSKTDVGPFQRWIAYEYSATLPVPVAVTASVRYWLEIKNNTVAEPINCHWYWMPNATGGNDFIARTQSGVARTYGPDSLFLDQDRTFCLNTAIAADDGGDILGSCCVCPNACSEVPLADCNVVEGIWSLGRTCSPNPCAVGANDTCAGATVISEGVTPYSTLCATTDEPEDVSCEAGNILVGSDIWYQYTAPCNGLLTVSLCDNTFYDSTLVIYSAGTDTCSCPGVADQILCNNDGCEPSGPSVLAISATGGTCYTIRVAGSDGKAGFGEVEIQFDPLPPDTPLGDLAGIDMNRFLPLVPQEPGEQTAIRVTMQVLQVPDPPNNKCCPAPDFSEFETQFRWLGPPMDFTDTEDPLTTFKASALQCDPYYTDWGNIGLVHAYGREVVPSSLYDVHAIFEGANTADEANYSGALPVTTARWGNVNNDSSLNVIDPQTVVDKFREQDAAPSKTRTQLFGETVDPTRRVNFLDVWAADGAIRGGAAYPFGGPEACPVAASSDDAASGTLESRLIRTNEQRLVDRTDADSAARGGTAVVSIIPVNGPVAYPAGVVIDGNEITLTEGGVRVWLELRVSDWDTSLIGNPKLNVFQARFDPAGFTSGDFGTIAAAVESCGAHGDCTAALGTRSRCSAGGTCTAGFQDTTRTDWALPDGIVDSWSEVDVSTPGARFGFVPWGSTNSLQDLGNSIYAGTLVLDVPEDAVGTFTIGLDPDTNETFLYDETEPITQPIPIGSLTPALITVAGVAPTAEISLKPVNATGVHFITGSNITVVGPGQTITLEVKLSDWAPDLLGGYQADIDSSGYTSGTSGLLTPLVTPNAAAGAFIDQARSDFVFFGKSVSDAVDTSSLDYRYVALVQDGGDAVSDYGSSKYGATLKLKMSPDASGTFTVGLDSIGTTLADDVDDPIPIFSLNDTTITVLNFSRVYVDENATGADTGESWTDAVRRFQDALTIARDNPSVYEVWVARGTYTPDRGFGFTPGDRTASFELISGMAFYGGFDGTETLLFQRAPIANPTTLSADLDADDLSGVPVDPVSNCCGTHGGTGCDTPSCEASVCAVAASCCSTEWDAHCSATARIVCCTLCGENANRCENSYHVVDASGTDSETLLSGFRIVGGLANDASSAHNRGGGVYAVDGNLTLSRCRFLGNGGFSGGGAYFSGGTPSVRKCTFAHGLVAGNGAGVFSVDASPMFRDCTFDDNVALSSSANGGGLFAARGAPSLVECVFSGNSSGFRGGGLAVDDNSTSITNCRFVNNAATIGGGISVLGGAASVTNTEFGGNVASSFGGALSVDGSDAQITNCTLSFNSATSGGGVGISGSSTAGISNSILWRNSDSNGTTESSQIEVVSGSATVAFSTVQGLDTFTGSNNIGTDPQFVDADGADGIPGNADDNLRLAPGSPAIDAGDTTALPSDTFDLDEDLDTAERLPIDPLGNDRLFDDLESVDTGNADPPTYLQVVDMGSYEYFTDCNNNGVVDAVDISMGTSQDCDSPSWPANGKPDECDIADCAGDPACDDCNLTGIPDACDIADGTSADLIGPFGVPDECAQFVDACDPPSDLWTDPCNWDLAGAGPLNLLVGAPSQPNEPPDSEALAMHGYPDNADGTPDVAVTLNAGDNVFLNESVTIPTLRLKDGAVLRFTPASGSVTAAGPTLGTDLIIEDSTSVGGSVLVGGDDCICVGVLLIKADCNSCVTQGDAVIRSGGRYMKDPNPELSDVTSRAELRAINVEIKFEECPEGDTREQCAGGLLVLKDEMLVVATGDLVLNGKIDQDTDPCDAPFGAAIAAVRRFHTPPIKRVTGRSRLEVSNNLTLIGVATSANNSTEGITVGGDFDNQLTDASCFDWTQGKLLLNGTKLQTFQVAARDQGPVADLSVAEYVIGTLEVAANSHVTFTDNFVNDLKGSSRDSEALYVETLIVGPNATITLNDVRIYYKNPPIIGEQATIIRKVNGELRSIHDPQPALQPAPDGQGSEVPKNRFISLVIPEPAPGDDPKTAIRVKLTTLHRTCSADSDNLFTPCSFDDDCVNGVCQTPFATGEGQVRYVNVVKTCQGAGAAGTKICRGPADCGEAEECLQTRNCAGTSQLCSDDEDCGEGVACLTTMSCPDDAFKPAFLCATTGCEPEYRDWAGELGGGVLHVYGPGIVPGRSEYDVKQMAASCEGNERCTAVSATLRISTARWADLTADGATNAADIAAASDKVKPIPSAFTKPRTMLIPGILNPFRNVNVLELQNTIDAVKSLPMSGLILGPQRCP